ncbi:hypothetical protein GQ54DRAFT_31902 [Martensiomyces pterosporus]|nr:hypothetical protein GQ54DRAFT_31902 [Martensiomyces pterosporus]
MMLFRRRYSGSQQQAHAPASASAATSDISADSCSSGITAKVSRSESLRSLLTRRSPKKAGASLREQQLPSAAVTTALAARNSSDVNARRTSSSAMSSKSLGRALSGKSARADTQGMRPNPAGKVLASCCEPHGYSNKRKQACLSPPPSSHLRQVQMARNHLSTLCSLADVVHADRLSTRRTPRMLSRVFLPISSVLNMQGKLVFRALLRVLWRREGGTRLKAAGNMEIGRSLGAYRLFKHIVWSQSGQTPLLYLQCLQKAIPAQK